MRRYLFIISTVLFIFSGCEQSTSHQQHGLHEEQDGMIDVSVEFPEEIKAEYPFTVKLLLTQEGNFIDKVDDVRVDVWQDSDEAKKTTYEASFDKDGIFLAELKIDQSGAYKLMYHVTAKGQHVMSEVSFVVKERAE
ncbi:FixH family protein [Metabacillus endolithicus]|uniref:FixH family protein n=1 Tax=Metabacillus endolithicus TaxID=1535204 RepID=A0ABW5BUV3_9BACI|nr:FixH family protein [Metabacillus endolithicus]UPG62843.1 FixH family protein [Metabacillus endolithicus]